MAKSQARYVCQQCGAVAPEMGRAVRGCGAWNSLVEEVPRAAPPKSLGAETGRGRARGLDFVGAARRHRRAAAPPDRHRRVRPRLRRRAGARLGDPGRRRSRHRQIDAAAAGRRGARGAWRRRPPTSPARRRSSRSGCAPSGSASPTRRCGSPRRAACATSSPRSTARRGPDLVVIDSIQTMYLDTLDSAPGTVSQVRGAAQELIGLAKRRGSCVVLVGHVTKEGLIAGPRVLEHMVDTVLYFEGERGHQFRILRAVKNRFGATDEIGVFEMSDRGLAEVPNPSALFLADRAVPIRRAGRSRSRRGRGGVRRHRGHAAGAGRGAGAGRAVAARHAAARGGRLGRDAAGDDPRRARRALRSVGRRRTTSISTSPAGCASSSRPPISRSRRRWSRR